jgi:hypothetical protein
MEVRTQRCILGCVTFPCHVEPLDLPMWWGWVPFSVWPGGVVRLHRLHTLEEGPLIQDTDNGPRARLRGGCEPAGGARV